MLFILHLPPVRTNIDYRAWADTEGGISLLEWVLTRLADRLRDAAFLVLCHSDRDRELADNCAGQTGVWVFRTPYGTTLEALSDLALGTEVDNIITFRPEIAFAPPDILTRLADFHTLENSGYTAVEGLPSWACPEAISSAALARLATMDFSGDPPEPGSALRELGSRRPDLLRTAVLRVDTGANPDIGIVTAKDAARARAALSSLDAADPFSAPHRWSEVRVPAPLPPGDEAPKIDSDTTRVLYVSAASGYAGAEESFQLMIGALRDYPLARFALVGAEGLLARRIREGGCPVMCPNWDFLEESEDADRLADHALNWARPDVVHCNSPLGPALARAVKTRGIPVVAHMRIADCGSMAQEVRGAKRIVAVSEFVAGELKAAGVSEEQIRVIWNGVDEERFRPGMFDRASVRRQHGIPLDAPVVLMVARLHPIKRHDLLLTAAAMLLPVYPDLRVVCVADPGDRECGSNFYRMIADLGLRERVMVLPFQEDVRPLECAADVIVLPSDREAFGRCILEGMALGIPAVVSGNGGERELVADGETGRHFRPGNAESLAAAIQDVLGDRERTAQMADQARQRFLQHFTLRDHAKRIAGLYNEFVGPPAD